MTMKNRTKLFTYIVGALFLVACVKPAHEEEFAPLPAKSCTDGILNQGEYFTDCGGPCGECGYDTYVSFTLSDKIWIDPDTTAIGIKSNKESFFFLDSSSIGIVAEDTLLGVKLRLNIDKNWRGVIVLDPSNISGYVGSPGNVDFESGVVTITNVDETYGYISGTFEFNCAPQPSTGTRIAVLEGYFRDIPTSKPQ